MKLADQINELQRELCEAQCRLDAVDFAKRVITRMGQKGYLYPGPVRAILRKLLTPTRPAPPL